VPATSLAQAHKHPHNRWSHDNAGFDRDSGGSAAIGNRESCRQAPASILAQVHKHPHNCRSHDNASFDHGSGKGDATIRQP
jgi:hypothetical protein